MGDRLARLALAGVLAAACVAPTRPTREAYVDDAASRRRSLEESLTNKDNGYA
jgi:hypothetical protein